jgi:hypothetical protein
MKKLLLFSSLLLCGCSASYRQQRDIKKLDGLVLAQPNEFARLSNLINPCFSGKAKSDTVIKTHTDTLINQGTTITVRVKDTVYVTKTTAGRTIINTRTLSIHDTIADGRAMSVATSQLKIKSDSLIVRNTQYTKATHDKNTWMWIAIGAIALIVIYIVAKVVIFFYGGGWANTIKKVI